MLLPGLWSARGDGRLPSRNVLRAGPGRGKPRPPGGSDGEEPARPPAPAALRASAPEDPETPPSPRACPRVTFQGAWSTRRVPGRLYGDGASGPPGAPLGPQGPRCPPLLRRSSGDTVPDGRRGPGRLPAPGSARGPPAPPSGATRSPAVVRLQADAAAAPVHLGAGPAGHGELRRPPSAPRPGRSGHGAGTQRPAGAPGGAGGGTRKGARGAGTHGRGSGQLRGTWVAGWAGRGHGQRGRARGAHGIPSSGSAAGGVRGGGPNMADPRPSGRPIGGTGGPGAGAVAPAANEGEAGPLPGPIPGGLRGGDPMAPRGADYLSGGARPTCGQWRRARPRSARQPEAVPGRPGEVAPR